MKRCIKISAAADALCEVPLEEPTWCYQELQCPEELVISADAVNEEQADEADAAPSDSTTVKSAPFKKSTSSSKKNLFQFSLQLPVNKHFYYVEVVDRALRSRLYNLKHQAMGIVMPFKRL